MEPLGPLPLSRWQSCHVAQQRGSCRQRCIASPHGRSTVPSSSTNVRLDLATRAVVTRRSVSGAGLVVVG